MAKTPLSEVASIRINAIGAGYGLRGSNGVVIVDLKKANQNGSLFLYTNINKLHSNQIASNIF